MKEPADQASRRRFACELDQNFSVTAAAGSGKTRAITDRIVQIARSRDAHELLPTLVVVTFANRAADEMQQRARQQILEAGVPLDVLAAFNRVYFGTIHSFAVKLLTNHGHHLGLPPTLELITDDDELWNQFVQRQTVIGRALTDEDRRILLRHVQARQLMELGRSGKLDAAVGCGSRPCPDACFESVYSYVARGNAKKIPQLQDELRTWEASWRDGEDFLRFPACTEKKSEFQAAWREAFAPLRKWVNDCSLCVAAEVQRDYREFRVDRGALTYADQITLALQLMRHPEAARRIREKNYRVILDEAQDTDPEQFSLLLEVTRPPSADGDWLQTEAGPPRAGHFCMVGDFQQSIYRSRADLARYTRVHDALLKTGAAEQVEFSVTFRLDEAGVDLVNRTFADILNNLEGQVRFVTLHSRPDALPGQVLRVELSATELRGNASGKIVDRHRAACEAAQLAQWLRATGLQKLRATNWSDVAILCPRKAWLRPIRAALRTAGFAVQIQSESEVKGDSPAYAWFTALIAIMADPLLSYEVVGVLREVFGVSDHELAVYAEGYGGRFQVTPRPLTSGAVMDALNSLAALRSAIEGMPLFSATQEIVKRGRLRERLRALPTEEFERLDEELDALVASAAAAEAEGATLPEFAQSLLAKFEAAREVQPASADAIQLITCHKAKGSEWQAVIVPFLTRRIRGWSERYPRLMKKGDETIVALDKDSVDPNAEAAAKRSERHEMERLLYVALTRAKHTLVLALDHQLFANPTGEVHDTAQLRRLRGGDGEKNSDHFQRLGLEPVPCDKTLAAQTADTARKTQDDSAERLPTLRKPKAASDQSSRFVRKFIPSAYAAQAGSGIHRDDINDDADPEFRPRVLDNAATRYGSWWHQLMERLDWTADVDTWDTMFGQYVPASPDPARSKAEWELFREFARQPEIASRRSAAGFHALPEFPFLWKVNESACLEGMIDLALLNGARNACLLIDWKTNRIRATETQQLREEYRPQLAAYWKAVTESTGMNVEAALYSTHTGSFLTYETNELMAEWARLQEISASTAA
jgi:ATP-dependent exoDNAse (exonuclease V) beta subunit